MQNSKACNNITDLKQITSVRSQHTPLYELLLHSKVIHLYWGLDSQSSLNPSTASGPSYLAPTFVFFPEHLKACMLHNASQNILLQCVCSAVVR